MSLASPTTGFTVWFTGMSGAGKSAIASGLANRLRRLGKAVEVLDGADAYNNLLVGKAQTKDERNAETRRLAWVCKLVTRAGGVVLQSAIQSPYRETRDEARRAIGRFAEVFVDCPIETLIARDKSGQYKRALAGELKNLVGISEPYEPPGHADVVVDSSRHSVDDAVEHIVGQLVALRFVDPALAGMRSRPKASQSPKPKAPAPAKKADAKAEPAAAAPAKGAKKAAAAKPAAKAPAKPAAIKPAKKAASGKVSARPLAAARAGRNRQDEPVRKAAGGKRGKR